MNVTLRTGECIRLNSEEAIAMKLIRDNRCNDYLNLSKEFIPLDVWHNMEQLILTDKVFPSIGVIDIRESNLTINDVHPDLVNIIIR